MKGTGSDNPRTAEAVLPEKFSNDKTIFQPLEKILSIRLSRQKIFQKLDFRVLFSAGETQPFS
jgi:hypothetical protein